MIKIKLRKNLAYLLAYYISWYVRKIVDIIIDKTFAIYPTYVYLYLMVLGEILGGLSIFLYQYNFQGRIALSPSLRFGLGGVIFLYLLQPVFERICDKLGSSRVKKIALPIMILLAADCIYTFFIR